MEIFVSIYKENVHIISVPLKWLQQKLMILTKTLQPLSNLFELENIKLYMNFSFFCFLSLIYLGFADFLSHGSHLPLL